MTMPGPRSKKNRDALASDASINADAPAAASASMSVGRTLDVLTLLSVGPRRTLGVTDIASELGLSKAVVHRILTGLRSRELVHLGLDRRYALGPGALALGLAYLRNIDVRSIARPEMELLSTELNETSTLSIVVGDKRVYVDQITPPRDVIMSVQVGQSYPLHAGSSSKAILAFAPEELAARVLERPLEMLTDSTVSDATQLSAELRDIRKRGYAVSLEERQPGAGSVAAPLINHLDEPVGSISVCGPADRIRLHTSDIIPLVVAAAERISRLLGQQPPTETVAP
jgi:IclR family acetate operon transcriptional repressor